MYIWCQETCRANAWHVGIVGCWHGYRVNMLRSPPYRIRHTCACCWAAQTRTFGDNLLTLRNAACAGTSLTTQRLTHPAPLRGSTTLTTLRRLRLRTTSLVAGCHLLFPNGRWQVKLPGTAALDCGRQQCGRNLMYQYSTLTTQHANNEARSAQHCVIDVVLECAPCHVPLPCPAISTDGDVRSGHRRLIPVVVCHALRPSVSI